MLYFTKLGALVPITFLLTVIAVLLSGPDKRHVSHWGYPLLAAALVSLAIGVLVNRKRKQKQLDRHHFMFIPVEYWGGVLLVGASVVFALEPLGLW